MIFAQSRTIFACLFLLFFKKSDFSHKSRFFAAFQKPSGSPRTKPELDSFSRPIRPKSISFLRPADSLRPASCTCARNRFRFPEANLPFAAGNIPAGRSQSKSAICATIQPLWCLKLRSRNRQTESHIAPDSPAELMCPTGLL